LSVALHSCTHQLHVCLCAVLVQAGGGAQLYIISLGVLAPYRDQGIGVTP
jgi:ribosomal protein S18 acetylase RimI-like enzyme